MVDVMLLLLYLIKTVLHVTYCSTCLNLMTTSNTVDVNTITTLLITTIICMRVYFQFLSSLYKFIQLLKIRA